MYLVLHFFMYSCFYLLIHLCIYFSIVAMCTHKTSLHTSSVQFPRPGRRRSGAEALWASLRVRSDAKRAATFDLFWRRRPHVQKPEGRLLARPFLSCVSWYPIFFGVGFEGNQKENRSHVGGPLKQKMEREPDRNIKRSSFWDSIQGRPKGSKPLGGNFEEQSNGPRTCPLICKVLW